MVEQRHRRSHVRHDCFAGPSRLLTWASPTGACRPCRSSVDRLCKPPRPQRLTQIGGNDLSSAHDYFPAWNLGRPRAPLYSGRLLHPCSYAALAQATVPSIRWRIEPAEVRSAIVLALLGFVVWPLLPDRFVDPWKLLQPREAWITVVIVACLGFVNYVLLRVYGSKGVYLTAILGGLVNSTASVAELATTLPSAGLVSLTTPVVLLTSVAMFLRNVVILAIFAPSAVRTAAFPLVGMAVVAGYWVFRDRKKAEDLEGEVSLTIGSPVSLMKILKFGILFLLVQVVATLGQRMLGGAGFQIVSVLGGLVSSASTTAASANLAMHGSVTASQAGMAAVLTSMASALVNLPIVLRQTRDRSVVRELVISSALQIAVGIAALGLQLRLLPAL